MKKTLIIAAMALIAVQSHADEKAKRGCKSEDLNGDYVMYQAAVNGTNLEDAGYMNHTGRCEVEIDDGLLSGSCAFDPNNSGNPNFNGEVYGTAMINRNCSVEMEIRFRPNPVDQAFEIVSIFDVQLTPDKQSLVGKFSNQFGVYGVTNGTRYSPEMPRDEEH